MFCEKLKCEFNRELDARELQTQPLMCLKGSYNSLKSNRNSAGLYCADFAV